MSSVASSLVASTLAAAVVLGGGSAAAQPTRAVKTETADYTEQSLSGEQVIKFTGDELAAPPGGPYGDTIRPAPGPVKVGLIRPRLNFIPELLKSVENL
jgi:hypothetical protein